ncbi:MAG: hypothetical protein MZV64_15855 [Ignavibacteriales bacterium]|nr:hypothetical protein [Ignavibacteriales bacterium]
MGGSSSVEVVFMDTHASIGADATIVAGQNVMVEAKDRLEIMSAAGGLAISGGGSGVGIGLDVGVIDRSTTAWIGSGADVTATGGDLAVKADSLDDIHFDRGDLRRWRKQRRGRGIHRRPGAIYGNAGLHRRPGSLVVKPASSRLAGTAMPVTSDGHLDALMIGGSVGVGSSAGIEVASTVLVHIDTVEARIGDGGEVESNGTSGVEVGAEVD